MLREVPWLQALIRNRHPLACTVRDKKTDQSEEIPMDRIHKRREGTVPIPESTDGDNPNNQQSDKGGEDVFDEWGIPVGINSGDDGESE